MQYYLYKTTRVVKKVKKKKKTLNRNQMFHYEKSRNRL